MLELTQLVGFGAQEARTIVEPTYFNFDATNATTYTFTDVPVGPPSKDRIIVAGFVKSGLQSAATVSAHTIGDGSGTVQVQANNGGSYAAAITSRRVPAGDTATISITWSGTGAGRCGVFVASIYGAKDEPLGAGRTASVISTAPGSMALDAPERGAAFSILHWAYATTNGTAVFDALPKYNQSVVESGEFAGAAGALFGANAAFPAGATFSGTSGALMNLIGLSAVWTPL